MYFVLSLNGDHLLKEKDYWVLLTNFGLRKNLIKVFMTDVIGKILIKII